MEKERKALDAFVTIHAKKALLSKERCVYLVQYNESGIPIDVTLERYTFDKLLNAFNTDSTLVKWLLKQINSYDVDKEILIGLKFSTTNVLAHVVRVTPMDEED